jgi:uncharacterized membrane protein YhfC
LTIAGYLIAIAIDVLFPIAVAIWVRKRFGVRWRYLAMGAVVFGVSQMVLRIPAMKLVEYFIADTLTSSDTAMMIYLGIAAVTAGIFEEVGRFLGWKVLLKKLGKTFDGAVMYGVGHGGLESALLVGGMAVAGMIAALVIPGLDPESMGLPPDQVEQLVEAQQQIASMPWWLPILGGIERIFAMCVQIAMSVLVVQCFVRGSIKWLWIAIGYHAFIDFAAVFAHQTFGDSLGLTWGTVATEGVVAAMAFLSLGIILRLKPGRRAEP